MVKEIVKTKTKSVKPYIFAVGRRRSAVARVRLYNPANGKLDLKGVEYKKGDLVVNGKPVQEFFRFVISAPTYNKMMLDLGVADKFIFSAVVAGGGQHGQMDALVLGIARCLDKFDRDTFHTVLREKGLLTRDSRVRERRKVGNAGKARRKKSSPKR